MKTIFTFCLIGAFSLIFHQNLSAQNSNSPFTAPTTSALAGNSQLVKITNFTGSINNEKVLLNWTIEENQEANQFEVERSANGTDFVMAALVFGTDKKDTDHYMFYEKVKNAKTTYRVKIILKNGTITYSPAITPGV